MITSGFTWFVESSWKFFGFPYRFLDLTNTSKLGIVLSLRHGGVLHGLAGISGGNKLVDLCVKPGFSGYTGDADQLLAILLKPLIPNLVNRQFSADRPNRLWVSDITYVRALSGLIYAAFITYVYSRKIVGWATRSSMKTKVLPLQALEQTISLARDNLAGLPHHCNHCSQCTSIDYNDKLTT